MLIAVTLKSLHVCSSHGLLPSDLVAQSVEKRGSNPKVVGSFPTLVRVFLCPCVGPFPSVGLMLTWFIWGRKLAHFKLHSNQLSLSNNYLLYINRKKKSVSQLLSALGKLGCLNAVFIALACCHCFLFQNNSMQNQVYVFENEFQMPLNIAKCCRNYYQDTFYGSKY